MCTATTSEAKAAALHSLRSSQRSFLISSPKHVSNSKAGGAGLATLDDLLGNYGLKSARSIALQLDRMGRPSLRNLLEALTSYEPSSIRAKPSEFGFLAAGGRLGLGTAERVSRGLVLIADTIVIPYELGKNAQELLEMLDKNPSSDGFAGIKQHLGVKLYPFLHQYLRVKPLIDADLVRIGPALPEAPSELIHPLASHNAHLFEPWVKYFVEDNGHTFFEITSETITTLQCLKCVQ